MRRDVRLTQLAASAEMVKVLTTLCRIRGIQMFLVQCNKAQLEVYMRIVR
jgi:hypothetical protein